MAKPRLTIEQAKEVRLKIETGVASKRSLAKLFGVSRTVIQNICKQRTYRDGECFNIDDAVKKTKDISISITDFKSAFGGIYAC